MESISHKELFQRFVKSRSLGRHFRRLFVLEGLSAEGISREMPEPLARTLIAAAQESPEALLQSLGSHLHGLTGPQAEAVRERVGPNEIEQDKPLSWRAHLWHCYKTPFDLLLTLLASVSYLTGDMKATLVIGAMVVLSVLIRFWQEGRSSRAADRLKAMVSNTATVVRRDLAEEVMADAQRYFELKLHPKPPRLLELPVRQLVPGDLIRLSAGDMIPADCRVLSAKDLFVSQAAMTGESLPVEKFAELKAPQGLNPLEMSNLLFMGTNVVSGSALAVVVSTGKRSYFGALAQRLSSTDRSPTQFQAGVNKVAWLLIRFMFVMAPLVLFINGFTKGDWGEALLFAMSVAVGLTPEMLPMIVTSTLAKGAVVLSRQKVIVKRLDAIQNFGAMDILCTDKTGTLTQDKIVLARHMDVWGDESEAVLQAAYLNSYYQTGLKNLLDVAVLEHAELDRALQPADHFPKVDEIPFDFQRRRMSVVTATPGGGHRLICKGALEEVLAACTRARHGEQVQALDMPLLEHIRKLTSSLNEDGLRVVAVASKELAAHRDAYGVFHPSAQTENPAPEDPTGNA